ncbi:hypothetical protein [Thauera aminoaromatica]|jgi:CHASE3 domain sensor protein|uniref:Histidine kinase n=1 Tax=Thauera aminoaromatica S2 TaxID=1234381 RepID=N6XY62_THASP|nr:hypothetical protein [Thauera aminoaromatica]ENO84210.1 histidine kinase [Thauera aminoaromatica S2]
MSTSDLPRKPTGVLAATLLILFGLALFVALAWSSHASLRELEAVTDARSRSRNGLLLAAEALRRTLDDLPQARLETLWTLVEHRVALAERNIADRRAYAEENSPWKQRLDEGRDTMDRIRARFAGIEAMLRAEIEARDRSLSALRAHALLLNVLLPAIGGALILAAWGLLQRERRRRVDAEAALLAANARLEDTVA